MKDLISIDQFNDIPAALENTVIAKLLAYHNLGHAFQHYDRPELLETESALKGAERLRETYPGITVVPFVFRVEDKLLYLPRQWQSSA